VIVSRIERQIKHLSTRFSMSTELTDAKFIQELWAGYGSVRSGRFSGQLAVEKTVNPPASGSGISHERKLQSNNNEICFYRNYAKSAIDAGIAIARPLLLEEETGKSLRCRLVLEDLRERFPRRCPGMLSERDTKATLLWLARFHAHFVGSDLTTGLWEQGSFWHLATRQDELRAIPSSFSELKELAGTLDARLRRPGLAHRTMIHGDAKSENFLFTKDGATCAAYDFQYAGSGLGAQDVAYVLASSVEPGLLRTKEIELLRFYHDHFVRYAKMKSADLKYDFDAFLLDDYEIALLDYCRFMAGWGWWGNTSWAKGKMRDILDRRRSEIQACEG